MNLNTPPNSKLKLQCKRVASRSDIHSSSPPHSSISSNNLEGNQMEFENDSPLYFPTTQESNDEIDVIWDWHSPQTSQRRRLMKQKRLMPIHSPKLPIKRSHSNNENLEKLREELKALQADLAVPDDEDSLRLSPLQEVEIKEEPRNNEFEHTDEFGDIMDDMFNDDLDEQLLQCTQKVERELFKNNNKCTSSKDDKIINKSALKKEALDDSFNDVLSEAILKEDFDQRPRINFHRTLSDDCFNKSPKQVIGNLGFPRTKSFDTENKLTPRQLQEIERKKQEALAKRLAKQKLEANQKSNNSSLCQNLLTKEKLEEIERKRQEALAKRLAKMAPTTKSSSISSTSVFQISTTDTSIKNNVIQTVSGKLEIHRTKSFELDVASHNQCLSTIKLEEIEKNKREALARLEAKRKQQIHVPTTVDNISPMKCSPEEIENKRLQARAKLEAKQLQDMVEKNKQEALKRLQNSRMKNAGAVRGALTKSFLNNSFGSR